MKGDLAMFRIMGHAGDKAFDEYEWAENAQKAVDKLREWMSYSVKGTIEIEEVFKAVKCWN